MKILVIIPTTARRLDLLNNVINSYCDNNENHDIKVDPRVKDFYSRTFE